MADTGVTQPGPPPLDFAAIFGGLPTAYLVMTPDLVIVDANDAYLALLGRTRVELVGVPVFAAFPPSPNDLDEHGRNLVQVSFERARDTGIADHMPLQRYTITDRSTGVATERFWSLISAPILGPDGGVRYVLQRTEDVSDYVRERRGNQAAAESGLLWRRRVEEVEADLSARARELRAVADARDLAAKRLAALSEIALALTAAETLADVERIVVGQGLPVLGAQGGALVTRDSAGGGWQLTASVSGTDPVREAYAHAEDDSPLPAVWSADKGERLLLPTRAAGLRFHQVMSEVYDVTGRDGWAFLPLLVRGRCLGSLTIAWADEHTCSPDELESLEGLAAQCAQALERINATRAERRAAEETKRFSETLQRSMLTPPPAPDHLHIVVRYQPALHQAQIGGDWYDAFTQPDGATVLVIGDVVGHDGTAAAHMGQLRGLLRALAFDPDGPPAGILSRAERVARGLAVDVLATVVLARIERTPDVAGGRVLRWSNAGHLPMVLLAADGTSRLLEAAPDLLLGVDPDTPRHDHTAPLPDGSTLLMFTDGLVERRGESLDVGLARLQQVLTELGETPMDEFCDVLIQRMVADGAEDDIALLGMRAYPEDAPPEDPR